MSVSINHGANFNPLSFNSLNFNNLQNINRQP
jgi:hypothetical protein